MTITDDLGIDDLCAVLDAEAQAEGSMVGSALSDLALADAASPAASVRGVSEPECRSTRAAMHDYLNRRLQPRRRRRFETHLDSCAECIRAFIDIREGSWTRRTAVGSATLTITRAGTTGHLAGAS